MVDVSTLTQLAEVRRGRRGGRWRVAGAVFAVALAELHATGVGIVTPYRLQFDATLAALRDRGLDQVAIGVAAETPDQAFDTAVLDLVDDGPGWAAPGSAGDPAVDGVFGAALAAAVTRLYVLADGRAVREATTGPLAHLRGALDRGEVRVWSAAALLGLAAPPAVVVDSAFTDAARLVHSLMPVTPVHDDAAFAAELARHVEGAQHTVWMWSPWMPHRAETVTPLLAAAAARSVDVRLFVRPEANREQGADAADIALAAAGATTVIRSGHEHRGLVVVDGRTVLLGTGDGPWGEGMVTLTGARFAERLLDELHGPAGGRPRACPSCAIGMEARRSSGRGRELRWLCAPCQAPVAPAGADSARA